MKRLPILQSGFLSLTDVGLAKSEPLPDSAVIRSYELGKPMDSSGNAFFYNKDVQAMFDQFNVDDRVIKSFEFRENALRVIKAAFATKSFSEWVTAQMESPFLTTMHRRFLNDTLDFISNGRREVASESWLGLIFPREITQSDQALDVQIGKYFRQPYSQDTIPSDLTNVIANWTSREGGFQDLIYSKQSSMTI
jgi:hypothetical protein